MKYIWMSILAGALLAPTANAAIYVAPQVVIAPPPVVAAPPVVVARPQVTCSPFVQTFTIGREVHQARGTACLMPDGAWKIMPGSRSIHFVSRHGRLYFVPHIIHLKKKHHPRYYNY